MSPANVNTVRLKPTKENAPNRSKISQRDHIRSQWINFNNLDHRWLVTRLLVLAGYEPDRLQVLGTLEIIATH